MLHLHCAPRHGLLMHLSRENAVVMDGMMVVELGRLVRRPTTKTMVDIGTLEPKKAAKIADPYCWRGLAKM